MDSILESGPETNSWRSLIKKPVDQANKVRGANPDFPGFGLFEYGSISENA